MTGWLIWGAILGMSFTLGWSLGDIHHDLQRIATAIEAHP